VRLQRVRARGPESTDAPAARAVCGAPPRGGFLRAALAAVALADTAQTRVATPSGEPYKNKPIVDPESSAELSVAGGAFEYTQYATKVFLPQANGWCKNNIGCQTNVTNGNSEQCYSIFYPVPECVFAGASGRWPRRSD